MTIPPNLLNEDGSASIATAVMMSHHGFRRDLSRFRGALERLASGDGRPTDPLQQEWTSFVEKLHGHHTAEDTGIFPGLAQQGGAQAQSETRSKVVNINTATAAELEALPGVGAATAARIIEYREKNGAFKKVEDLMNVRGIGEKTFLNLKSLITVAPPKVTRA